MYIFTNLKTGKIYRYATLQAASRAKDRQDSAYGAVCTTYPKFVA
jgi:cytidylate kinase